MPVNTVSSEQVTFVKGRPQLISQPATKSYGKYGHQAYNNSTSVVNRYKCRAEQRTPRLDLVTPGSPVALDCEGVILDDNVGSEKCGVGRVSLTNIDGKVVYDSFVNYPKNVKHRPSPQWLCLGVKYKDILPQNGAQAHAKVLADVKAVLDKSGILVAHAAREDMKMLRGIDFSGYVIRDTQAFWWKPYTGDRKEGLAHIASKVLGLSIQTTEHSSVEDARATMDLFLWYRKMSGYETGCGYDGKPLVKNDPVDEVGTSGGAIASNSDSTSGTPTSGANPLDTATLNTSPSGGMTSSNSGSPTSEASPPDTATVTPNTSPSGGATTPDSNSPTSGVSPRESISTNPSSSSGRSFTPGHIVAPPDIKTFARGRIFDRKTSTYSASNKRSFAPGHLVALPDIKALARGRVFDRKTSTYL
jgi:RNA exonuclease 4